MAGLKVQSPHEGVAIFTIPGSGGDFEADLVLSNEFWDVTAKKLLVCGSIVIAIPVKSLLFVCSSDDVKALEFLKWTVRHEYQNAPRGAVSDQLFVRNQGWSVRSS